MGEDCRTWKPHLQFGRQWPNLTPLDVGKQDGCSAVMNPNVDMISRKETMPALVSPALPHSQLRHSNEPNRWLYCLPRFQQELPPFPNFTAEVKHLADRGKGFIGDKIASYGESSFPQKQVFVVDQTGGQTNIVHSSRFGSPCASPVPWQSKLHAANCLGGNGVSFRRDLNLNHIPGETLADHVDENQRSGIESEMHEDTDEINALLYSESDEYSTGDDDEVTSTGNSPSIMTTYDKHKTLSGTAEEVASSAGKSKKRKLMDNYYDEDIQSLDSASSLNPNKSFALEDDAESRCSGGNNEGSGEMGSLSGNKKMKKEKIQDVLSILQNIIPGSKDKDPIMLLDDAIRCLKSLKHKAKELGLDAE